MASAAPRSSSTSPTASVVPGAIGTPAVSMRARAAVLSPITRIASTGGPIHAIPAASTASAKAAFSERKP